MEGLEKILLKSTNDGILLGIKETKKYLLQMISIMKTKRNKDYLNEQQISLIIDQMYELHEKQFNYADANTQRWKEEHKNSQGNDNPWPYTNTIQRLGLFLRLLKTFIPVIAAVLFIVSLF